MKIVAVDDDPVFTDILVAMLGGIGEVDVTTYGSSLQALKELSAPHAPFDCVLLDLQMPGMDGIQLCAALRRQSLYRRVPIVMITSMSARGHIDAAFAAGATDYITKPLDRLDLKARIGMVARLVEERRQTERLAREADLQNEAMHVRVDFQTPILVPDFERGIEYLALQNYLLTLGMKGMLAVSAIGIRIDNAALIFSRTSRANFVGMLGDVASVIADVTKSDDLMVAYAGNGDFVCVVRRPLANTSEDMEKMINLGLEDFEGMYASDRLPLPQVRVGRLAKSSFFSSTKPTRILDRAMAAAQRLQAERRAKPWESAA